MLIPFLHRYSWTFAAAILMAVMVSFSSCSASKKVRVSNYANLVSCHQVNTFDFKRANPQPLHQLSLDTVLSNHFSLSSLNIANAFGFLDLLKQYVDIQNTYPVKKI